MKIKVLYLLMMFASTLFSQVDTTTYYITYGDSSIEYFNEIKPTFDGGYIAVGTSSSTNGTSSDIYVVKLDSNFQKEWSKTFGSTYLEVGKSIVQTLDSNYVFCGFTNKTQLGDYDVYVEKIDRNGNFLWESFLGGADWDFANKIIELSDSSLIIAGSTYSFGNNAQGYLIKLSQNGMLIWENNYGSSAKEEFNSLTLSLKNELIAVGISDKNFTTDSTDIYFVKTDTAGAIIADTAYGGIKYDDAKDVVALPDSSFVTVGSSNSQYFQDLDYYLLKIDKNNNKQWEFFGGYTNSSTNKDEIGKAITTVGNEIVFTATTETYGEGKKDIMLVALDFFGNWINKNNSFGFIENEESNDVLFARGHYIIAGKTNSQGYGQYDALIIVKDTIAAYRKDSIQANQDVGITGVDSYSYDVNIKLFPNPFSDNLTIQTSLPVLHYTIFDIKGRLIKKEIISSKTISLNMLPKGMYVIQLNFIDRSVTRKIIKQ